MADLEIIFKTKAELAGAIAAREALERQVGAAKALGQATTELEAKIARMNQTLSQHAAAGGEGGLGHFLAQVSEQALKAIPGLEGVAGAVGKLARGPLTIAGVGLQAAALGFKTLSASIAQFAQAEADVAKLDLALAQAGQLTDAYREKLQALAHELSESTAKSGTEWLGVLQRLTQFGAKPENISEYADAVKNLAGIMGGNIEEAAFIFSQAMQGNIEMLARWGIHVDTSKTKAQQLDEVMKQIALRGGGQLEARAQTLGGQFEKLEHSTGRLLAVLGGGGAGTLSGIATILTDAFEYWSRVLGGPIAQLDSLTNTGSKAAGALHDAALAAKEFSDAQKKIDDAIQNSITAMKSQYTAIGQMIDLEKKEIAAKKELALAHLAADEASGTISSSEALRRRGAVTGQAAAATTALEIRAVETQRGEARAELSNAYYRQMATGVDVENQHKRIAGAQSLEPARKQARDDESARIKAQHDLAVAEELAKPGFSMADPEERQRAIRDLPELRRMAASTTTVAGISAGQAAAGEADFVGMQERLAELEKIKAKADHDVEQALLTLNPKIAAFTRELESLSKISALQEATEGIKAHTELRQSQNAQLKKSLEELNKVPDPTSSIDGLSDAVVEKMQTAVDGLNRMKLRLDQLDLRTANLR